MTKLKRHVLLLAFYVTVLLGLFVFGWSRHTAQAKSAELAATPPVTFLCDVSKGEDLAEVIDDSALNEDEAKLYGYFLAAMTEWNKSFPKDRATHLEAIAADVARVVWEEPKVWTASDGAREGIMLLSIAWFEDSYADYVDDGSCNRWAAICMRYAGAARGKADKNASMGPPKRARGGESYCAFETLPRAAADLMKTGTCDGGNAASIWQVHFGSTGIVVGRTPDGREWKYAEPDKGEVGITKDMGIHTRRYAARVALAMVRQSIQRHSKLCGYTGEEHACPKGNIRYAKAVNWSATHPFVASKAD